MTQNELLSDRQMANLLLQRRVSRTIGHLWMCRSISFAPWTLMRRKELWRQLFCRYSSIRVVLLQQLLGRLRRLALVSQLWTVRHSKGRACQIGLQLAPKGTQSWAWRTRWWNRSVLESNKRRCKYWSKSSERKSHKKVKLSGCLLWTITILLLMALLEVLVGQ